MFPDLIHKPSPSWNERPAGVQGIDTVIIHYTGMHTAGEALSRLCDEDIEVSAHFLIDEDGKTYQLVAPEQRAWHAGVSHWQGRDNMNHTSIGVELVNPGHEFGYRCFPDAQITALLKVLAHLKATFDIPQHRFLGHSDIAPDRKADPGELFPWGVLADAGFGIWLDKADHANVRYDASTIAKKGMSGPEIAQLNEDLRLIGYNVDEGNAFTEQTLYGIKAFQRHWRQSSVTGILDVETSDTLKAVVKLMRGCT